MQNITRRNFIKSSALAAGAFAFNSFPLQAERFSRAGVQPNLVMVFPDQMRGSAMGFLGEEKVLTPRLDRFAKESIVLTQAASNYPLCSPFRASLLTGQYPITNGVIGNCNSKGTPFNNELRDNARCWSDVLKGEGYSLGYIGKWHLDTPREPFVACSNNEKNVAWNEWCPPNRRHGFDFWYSYGTYDQHLNPMYWGTNDNRDEAHYVQQWGPEHEADMAIQYLENKGNNFRDNKKPFALVVSMNPPHTPYNQVPQKYVDLYKDMSIEELCNRDNIPPAHTKWGDYYRKNIKHYYACISGIDEQFGRILDALDKNNFAQNTIVLFFSDHGDCIGVHSEISKNNPFEEAMHVPMMIRYPGQLKHRTDDLLMSAPDIYPTMLDLLGFSSSIPSTVEGRSYAKLLRTGNGKRPSSQLYFQIPVENKSGGVRGIRTERYTLIATRVKSGKPTIELYDRNNDKFELKNVAHENENVVKKLITEELIPGLERINDPWLSEVMDLVD